MTSKAQTKLAKRTARRLEDGNYEAILGNGTAVIFRPVDFGDLAEITEDENMLISSLVIKWGDRTSVMGSELSSRGFLDIQDAIFLKKILRRFVAPDSDKLDKKTLVKDLGEGGVKVVLPSGLPVHLRRPDGHDLEEVDLTQVGEGERQGLELAKASVRLAALLSIAWGDKSGDIDNQAVTYDELLERGALPSDDVFALLKVISENFFRVEDSIEF